MQSKSGVVEYYLSNGLLFAFLQKNVPLNRQTVSTMIEKRKEIELNGVVPLIIITNGKHNMDKEARKLLASEMFTKMFTSIAVFCNNTFVDYTFSFFAKVEKADVSIKVFNSKLDAEKWSLLNISA
jgi:hypothetical protein